MDAALTQRLKQDLHTVVIDAEELLKATASQTGERVEKIRVRAEESLRAARERIAEASAVVGEKARVAADSVDGQVHKHPYAAAGMAAGIGLLVGLLIGRR
jgi:ElaB/YqjD/DUF883 family membrane-anchored ribosome-binding protein